MFVITRYTFQLLVSKNGRIVLDIVVDHHEGPA